MMNDLEIANTRIYDSLAWVFHWWPLVVGLVLLLVVFCFFTWLIDAIASR